MLFAVFLFLAFLFRRARKLCRSINDVAALGDRVVYDSDFAGAFSLGEDSGESLG